MLIPRRIAVQLVEIAGKEEDDRRYAFSNVQLTRKPDGKPRAVVTDGATLLVAEWDEDEPKDFPLGLTNTGIDLSPKKECSILVPAKALAKIARKAPLPKRNQKPILENVAIEEQDGDDPGVSVAVSNLNDMIQERLPRSDGKYPSIIQVVPDKKTGFEGSVSVLLDPAALATLAGVFAKIQGEEGWEGSQATLTVWGTDRAIALSYSRNGKRLFAMLRACECEHSGPEWVPDSVPVKEPAPPKPTKKKRPLARRK